MLGGLLRLPHDDAGTVVNPRVPDIQIEAGIVGEPWPANPKSQTIYLSIRLSYRQRAYVVPTISDS